MENIEEQIRSHFENDLLLKIDSEEINAHVESWAVQNLCVSSTAFFFGTHPVFQSPLIRQTLSQLKLR